MLFPDRTYFLTSRAEAVQGSVISAWGSASVTCWWSCCSFLGRRLFLSNGPSLDLPDPCAMGLTNARVNSGSVCIAFKRKIYLFKFLQTCLSSLSPALCSWRRISCDPELLSSRRGEWCQCKHVVAAALEPAGVIQRGIGILEVTAPACLPQVMQARCVHPSHRDAITPPGTSGMHPAVAEGAVSEQCVRWCFPTRLVSFSSHSSCRSWSVALIVLVALLVLRHPLPDGWGLPSYVPFTGSSGKGFGSCSLYCCTSLSQTGVVHRWKTQT